MAREAFLRKGQDHAESQTTIQQGMEAGSRASVANERKIPSSIARDLARPESPLCHGSLREASHGKDAFPASGHLPPLEEEHRR